MEVFWNEVLQLQAADADLGYKFLPVVIKSALVLGQTNAESEGSLSVNARWLAQERAIVGLHIIKDAVRFHDPVSNSAEMIQMTQDLRKSVRSPHLAYKANQESRKEEQGKKKKKKASKEKEISDRLQKREKN